MNGPVVRVGMAPRRAGLTLDEFRRHYGDVHGGIANQIPGVLGYVQWHPLADDTGRRPLPYPGFDACSMMDFASVDDLEAAFTSTTYQETVRDDERRFVDPDKHSRMVGTRLIGEVIESDEVALVGLWRRHPEARSSELRGGIERWACSDGGRVVEVLLGLDQLPDGRPNAADAVTVRAFATVDDAVEWALGDGVRGSDQWPLSRLVFGAATFVAQPHRMV